MIKSIPSKIVGVPVELAGIGHYFPGEPVTNEELEKLYGFDNKWIVEHTGVSARHWADTNEERHLELAQKASEMAIKDAGITVEDIDVLICTSSTTRAVSNPSTRFNRYMDIAPPLQAAIGAKKAFVFDVSGVACLGFVDISTVAVSLLNSLNLNTALVVCAENPKPILNFKYKNSTLFGAGAAAAVWKRSDSKESGLIDVVMHSDGSHFNAFDIDDDNNILMKGKEVSAIGTESLINVSREIFTRNNIGIDDVDWFIPHQANINMINKIASTLSIPKEKLLLNIGYRGNTSSVGGPSCLSENVHKGIIKPGDTIFTCSFGRGVNWGGILFKYKK
ncbi:ketoacyl-ACP synthase III [Clostridium felsineum]|uniref:ketoacyl-ACP synthase III n=1 Tax=Clostridium felsineum TaxID=36839 RepID=UPI00098CB04B|nr:ketoacyl-ACP synthase III [Clostridium felsineum]URZ14886.1 3-oxoacyl-[acyl-carrier-protein] synthase 3 [Clostridium felsineum DSM 794]